MLQNKFHFLHIRSSFPLYCLTYLTGKPALNDGQHANKETVNDYKGIIIFRYKDNGDRATSNFINTGKGGNVYRNDFVDILFKILLNKIPIVEQATSNCNG